MGSTWLKCHHFLGNASQFSITFSGNRLKNEHFCFLLNDQKSISEQMKTFRLFSKIFGLKPNISKCEVAGIGSLKGVKISVSSIKYIELRTKVIKILGVYIFLITKI